jgi:hypothetical protein
VRAGAEAEQLDDADLVSIALHEPAARHRYLDALALDLHRAVAIRAGCEHLQLHAGAGRALDAAGGHLAVHPGDRAPVHAEDEVAAAYADVLGRCAVEHAQDLQPAPVLLDVHAHALELPADRIVEGVRLLRCEVVRVGVVERLHDPLQ